MSFTHEDMLTHMTALRNFAWRLCKNRADLEDLVQTTYQKALEKKASYTVELNLRAWLYSILYHSFIDEMRKFRRVSSVEVLGEGEEEFIEPAQEHVLELLEVQAALEKMTPHHREIILMARVYGYSEMEISALLTVSRGTVKSRLHRAEAMLRHYQQGGLPPRRGGLSRDPRSFVAALPKRPRRKSSRRTHGK